MVPYIPQLLPSNFIQNNFPFFFLIPQFDQCGESFGGKPRLEESVCVVGIEIVYPYRGLIELCN